MANTIGSISSLEHAARSIEEHVLRLRDELARSRTNLAELTALTGKIFEHEERCRELLKRQGELVYLLDITKNQAAAQQAAKSADDVESVAATTADENEVSDSTIEPEVTPTTEGDEVENTVTNADTVETVAAALKAKTPTLILGEEALKADSSLKAAIAKAAGIGNPKRIYVMRKQIRGRRPGTFLALLAQLLEVEAALTRGTAPGDAFRDGFLLASR